MLRTSQGIGSERLKEMENIETFDDEFDWKEFIFFLEEEEEYERILPYIQKLQDEITCLKELHPNAKTLYEKGYMNLLSQLSEHYRYIDLSDNVLNIELMRFEFITTLLKEDPKGFIEPFVRIHSEVVSAYFCCFNPSDILAFTQKTLSTVSQVCQVEHELNHLYDIILEALQKSYKEHNFVDAYNYISRQKQKGRDIA